MNKENTKKPSNNLKELRKKIEIKKRQAFNQKRSENERKGKRLM
jgi:hypothetical protein